MDKIVNFITAINTTKLISISVGIFIVMLIGFSLKRIIPKYISSTSVRYRTRKFINVLSYFFVIILIMATYSNKLQGLSVLLGVAGAGIAFAMQEVITSFAGFIAINFSHFYKVGDRVLLGGIKGDVVDIGLLRTSLMEIGDWVDGDLYNGRITRVANSFVFKEPVYNYSGEFPFLWDEIKVPIKTDGDFEWATKTFYDILLETQKNYQQKAFSDWQKMKEKLMVENAQLKPMVKLTFNENWITFNLRYVVDYKERRSVKDIISRKVLNAIRNSNGKVQIASSSEVTLIQ